jgi:hypothetical protein
VPAVLSAVRDIKCSALRDVVVLLLFATSGNLGQVTKLEDALKKMEYADGS